MELNEEALTSALPSMRIGIRGRTTWHHRPGTHTTFRNMLSGKKNQKKTKLKVLRLIIKQFFVIFEKALLSKFCLYI